MAKRPRKYRPSLFWAKRHVTESPRHTAYGPFPFFDNPGRHGLKHPPRLIYLIPASSRLLYRLGNWKAVEEFTPARSRKILSVRGHNRQPGRRRNDQRSLPQIPFHISGPCYSSLIINTWLVVHPGPEIFQNPFDHKHRYTLSDFPCRKNQRVGHRATDNLTYT